MASDRDDVSVTQVVIGGTILAVGVVGAALFCTSQTGRGWRVRTLGGVTTLERTLRDDCAMCQASMEAGSVVRTLSCDHVFHKECAYSIDRWLRENRLTCPICRRTAYPVLPWKAPPPPPSPPSLSPSSVAVRTEEQDLEGQNELPPPPILTHNPEEQNPPLPLSSSAPHTSGLEEPLLQP